MIDWLIDWCKMAVLNVGTGALETKTYEQTTMSTLATETTEGKWSMIFFLLVIGTLDMPSAFFEYMQG